MNGHLAIHKLLSETAGYNALVGGTEALAKIFYDEADATTALDFCIVKLEDIDPTDNKDGVSSLDFDFVFVTHFSSTAKKCAALALAGRTACDRQSGTKNGVVVTSVQFQSQRSGTESLVDKKVHTIEQVYKVLTQQ
jgi:hypothetical protein